MPPHHEWLFNIEKEEAELSAAIEKFKAILSSLGEIGSVTLSAHGEKQNIHPKGEIKYIIRYERHHNSKLSLKMELIWNGRWSTISSSDLEIIVE